MIVKLGIRHYRCDACGPVNACPFPLKTMRSPTTWMQSQPIPDVFPSESRCSGFLSFLQVLIIC